MHALHPLHGIVVGAPHGDGAVLLELDLHIRRKEGGRAVVLGPVELDAARDPGAGEAHEGRLDHVVAVEEVVVGGLVVAHVDAAAELRQDHEPDPRVLEVHGLPLVRRLLLRDALVEREGEDGARGALVDAGVEEGRVVVGFGRQIRVDRDGFAPHRDGEPHQVGRSHGEDQSRGRRRRLFEHSLRLGAFGRRRTAGFADKSGQNTETGAG